MFTFYTICLLMFGYQPCSLYSLESINLVNNKYTIQHLSDIKKCYKHHISTITLLINVNSAIIIKIDDSPNCFWSLKYCWHFLFVHCLTLDTGVDVDTLPYPCNPCSPLPPPLIYVESCQQVLPQQI